LKSPVSKIGAGSCMISEVRSACNHLLGGGRYIEQSVIGLGVDIRQATACKVVLSGMTLWGMLFRRRIPAPPCGLFLLSGGGRFESKVYDWSLYTYESESKSSWRQNATGLNLSDRSLSSLRLARKPRQFHCSMFKLAMITILGGFCPVVLFLSQV
jgi:hypothetical protein